MRRGCAAILLFANLATTEAWAVGFVHSENFIVLTPAEASKQASQRYAQRILDSAERHRRQIALEWRQSALPDGAGRTVINVDFSESRNAGLTWQKDHPDRRLHKVYLETTRERALGGVLRHEVAHVVLATLFPYPHSLPVWLEEGIASRYDEQAAKEKRRQRLAELVGRRRPPRLAPLLAATNLASFDTTGYAAAESLVQYLLTLGDKRTLLQFGADGVDLGWDAAPRRHYGVGTVADLELRWTAWMRAAPHPPIAVGERNTQR